MGNDQTNGEQRLPKRVNQMIHAVGRRKESVARVYLKEGEGEIYANGKPAADYFAAYPFVNKYLEKTLMKPFRITKLTNEYDVEANLEGGGVTGQLEALQLGIARALVGVDESFKKPLKDEGLLTRDPRMVERKKYGRHKARKGQQFSKR